MTVSLSPGPDRRPPSSPVRGYFFIALVVFMFGSLAAREFADGRPLAGGWVVAFFFVIPAALLLRARRRETRAEPQSLRASRFVMAVLLLWAVSALGGLDLLTTKPSHRIPAAVITGVLLLAAGAVAWRNRRH